MVGPGIAHVRLKVIPPPPEPSLPAETRNEEDPKRENKSVTDVVERYAVQAGAFSTRARAESLEETLRDQFEDSRVVEGSTVEYWSAAA